MGYRIFFLASALVLAACVSSLEEAKRTTPQADEFGAALHSGYVELSEAEYMESDYRDASFFGERALDAAKNEKFEPQFLSARDLPDETLEEISNARRKLISSLYFGAADKMPQETASAQLAFDCWVQEQEENIQPAHIAACKDRFYASIETIEATLAAARPVANPSPPAILPDRLVFEVYFAFDKDDVTPTSRVVLEEVAKIGATLKEPVVVVIGNADTSGDSNYNYELSKRRAQTVADELEDMGLPVEGVFAHGQETLKLDTPDDVRAGLNRRAVVILREGELG